MKAFQLEIAGAGGAVKTVGGMQRRPADPRQPGQLPQNPTPNGLAEKKE